MESIDIVIPFEPEERLGFAINRIMKKIDSWVLILDHDVLVSLNPHWYEICQNAIVKIGNKAGWITCVTNQIGCPLQKVDYSIKKKDYCYSKEYDTNDIEKHYELAEIIYKKNKREIVDITGISKRWNLSGFFILTHKKAYNDVKDKFGLPDNKFIGWDNYYNARLLELGYRIYLMRDLYCYHGYKRLWKNKEWGQ